MDRRQTGGPLMVFRTSGARSKRLCPVHRGLIAMSGSSGDDLYNYDNMDRLSSKVTPEGTLSYTYDAAGNLASIASSNANGDEITHTGTTPNNYLYRGEQWDPNLGLYDLRARYYNPLSGRLMSRDPNAGNTTLPAINSRSNISQCLCR